MAFSNFSFNYIVQVASLVVLVVNDCLPESFVNKGIVITTNSYGLFMISNIQANSCDCLKINQCQWSQKALTSVMGLPVNDPRIKVQVELIKDQICDSKNRLVFCCGSAQRPRNIDQRPIDVDQRPKNIPGEFLI